ncbi:MAG: glycosyltransferase family 1 protein [Cytophagales bacterium]
MNNSNKKTIVLDARMLEKSGIGTYIKNIVNPIKEKYNLIFIGDEKEVHNVFPHSRVIHYTHPIYSIKEQLFIPTKVPRCDVFWSPHINIPLLPVLTKKRLVTIHDMFHAAQMPNFSRAKRTYTRLILNSLNIYKPEVITVSEFSKSEILKYTNIPEQKITVSYNGYDDARFKKTYSIARVNTPYALFVGNVKPHKNLKLIVEAFRILKNESSLPIQLKIVGKKDGFITGDTDVVKKIAEYGLERDVIFTGKISQIDLVSYYQNAQFLIFPSTYEGFGLPPLEAMACGTPSIVSDIPVLNELYKGSALFTPVDEPQKLASLIKDACQNQEVMRELKDHFSEKLEKFTWEKSQQIHLDVIDKLIQGKKSYKN